jgi:small conductance mechanosensitive channel
MDNFAEITKQLTEKLTGWWETLILMLPNFVIAVVVVLAFAFMARMVRKGIRKLMDRTSQNKAINNLLSTIVYVVIILAGSFVALGVLDLQKTVTSLLAGVGVIGLALGFAFQNTATNFISGMLMAAKFPMRVGDQVETNGHFGTVQEIGLRYTSLRSFQGQHIVIPNKQLLEDSLVNYTITEARRVDMEIGVGYETDLELASKTTIEAIESLDVTNDAIEVIYHTFGDSSINFTLRFWLKGAKHAEFLTARSKAVIAIKKAFDKEEINIPFPIRTLQFGKGQLEKLTSSQED